MFAYVSQRAQLLRAYADGIGKTVVIFPAAFAMAFSITQVNLGLVFFMRDIHQASALAVGWVSGIWALTYVFGCLVVRPWISHILPRYQLVMSAVLFALLSLAIQIAPSVTWLLIIQGVLGIALSFFWPPIMAWLSTGSEGADLGRTVSKFNVSWCTGMVTSPFVCGWLAQTSTRLPLFVGAGMALMTAALIAGAAAALPGARHHDRIASLNEDAEVPVDRSTPLRFPAWVGLFALYFGLGILSSLFPLIARSDLLMSESLIGFFLLIRAALNGVAFAHMGRVSYWHFRLAPMVVAQLLAAATFVLLTLTTSSLAIGVLFMMYGFIAGVGYTQSLFHGVSGSLDRSRRAAIHEALIGAGLFTGPVIGGVVYEHSSMRGVYLLSAALFVAAALTQVALGLNQKRAS